MKIKDQITEDSWITGNFYRRSELTDAASRKAMDSGDGDPMDEACRNSTACCLVGWLKRIYDLPERTVVMKRVHQVLQDKGYDSIVGFNDSPTTTYKDVEKLVQELNI